MKPGAAAEVVPHLLPCKVEGGSGEGCYPARVEDFFTPTIREELQTAPTKEEGESAVCVPRVLVYHPVFMKIGARGDLFLSVSMCIFT